MIGAHAVGRWTTITGGLTARALPDTSE